MTALTLTLPYGRVSPLYLPRRDLVLDAADSLSLAVTVIERDAPGAALIDLATGPTFPEFTLRISQDSTTHRLDYGVVPTTTGSVLAEIAGVISATLPGTVDFTISAGALGAWPPRCGWLVRMDHDDTLSETLVAGTLHVRSASGAGSTTLGGTFTLDSRTLGVLA